MTRKVKQHPSKACLCTTTAKVDGYKVIHRAVEQGIEHQIRRAWKYWDPESGMESLQELLRAHGEQEIMNEICEWVAFGEEGDDG
mgnify:CR=1 FL=1